MDACSQNPADQPFERRAHPRFAVETEADLLLVEHGLALRCRVLDLSLGGCRIRTPHCLPPGIHVRIELTFTVNALPFRLSGVIQRCDGSQILGVRFLDLSTRRQAEWADALAEIQTTLEIAAQSYSS